MWRHPKYYKELAKKRKEFEREQADKRASEQAIQETVPHNDIEEANRRVGGPTSNEPGSEQASDQASEEDSSNKR
jgi:hypothetical protein